ncbi:hypothetical protein T4D_5165 [Trichinella pseudospiralis]|uniref:Uncharacterized protein n=1 Tax=Trichinella pseudospiralis TaxID=6337 RepID=A0A0V1FEC4_TRIPS|nr:hypothetical protein T4D_5165 [Trichinella pseudospiralis]
MAFELLYGLHFMTAGKRQLLAGWLAGLLAGWLQQQQQQFSSVQFSSVQLNSLDRFVIIFIWNTSEGEVLKKEDSEGEETGGRTVEKRRKLYFDRFGKVLPAVKVDGRTHKCRAYQARNRKA